MTWFSKFISWLRRFKKSNKTHKIILVVGESSSGKDLLTTILCKDLKLKQLCSYATRPKREGEGDTHIFIKPEEANQYSNNIIAFTQIGEYCYFSTLEQLYDNHAYIIDPNGVDYMKTKQLQNIEFVTIYINVNEFERRQRARKRKDKEEEIEKRFIAEYEQFREFKEKANFDYSICNYDFNKAYDIFKYIVRKELGI